MKKVCFLLVVFLSFNYVARAQDDLPPPTSHPQEDKGNTDGFTGFKTKKKIDLSKFIIEPNFNLSIGNNQIVLGLSPL